MFKVDNFTEKNNIICVDTGDINSLGIKDYLSSDRKMNHLISG